MTAFTQEPAEHPEYFNRDARLKTMDDQGLEAAWLFPSHGVCIEGPMQTDIEASLNIMTGFNRWIDDEWGFAYKNRIFGVPTLSLTDLDLALRELEWVLERGARVITIRHGPAFTKDGYRSPADPMFDPFWARVEEARITMAIHAGSEQSYWDVAATVARAWNVSFDKQKLTDAMGIDPRTKRAQDYAIPFVMMLQKGRAVQDNAATLIAHGLFERFPRLRVAFIEFGATWVPTLLHNLQHAHGQNPGCSQRTRSISSIRIAGSRRLSKTMYQMSANTCLPSAFCSVPTGLTAKAQNIRATSLTISRPSHPRTCAKSWSRTRAN